METTIETKRCSYCMEVKDRTLFHKNSARVDGLQTYCSDCRKDRYAIGRSRAEPAKARATKARLADKGIKNCTSCGLDRKLEDFSKHQHGYLGLRATCRTCSSGAFRVFLLNKYGLTLESYDELLDGQNGVCAICGSKEDFVIDHNHTTKQVRGILCKKCNSGLGLLQDNPEILEKAITYLKTTSFYGGDDSGQ